MKNQQIGDSVISTVTPARENSAVSIVRSNSGGEKIRRLPPTLEASAELQYLFSYLNEQLHDGKLPECQITYIRKKNVLGYFAANRFERSNGEIVHEIALNPRYLAFKDQMESFSTLEHEICHLWRYVFGPLNCRGRRGTSGYHDLVWAVEMERIGLMPSDTGLPGGKRTGYRMGDYIIKGGLFETVCRELLDTGFRINWHDRVTLTGAVLVGPDEVDTPAPPKKNRIKFTCWQCGLNAWAKPSAKLICAPCDRLMLPAGSTSSLPALITRKGN